MGNITKTPFALLVLAIAGISPFRAIAQNKHDTIYYTSDWKKTIRDNAFYFRVLVKDSSRYKIEDHFLNGRTEMTGFLTSINPEIKDGGFKYYSEDGNLLREENYKNGKLDGPLKKYTEGHLKLSSTYKNGKLDGEFTTFYSDGKIKRADEYRDSILQNGTCYKESGKKMKYYPYQQKPSFRGDLNKYLTHSIKYPQKELEANKNGEVYLSFIIEKDGSVSTVIIMRGVAGSPDFDQEAYRVISSMPKWNPGMEDGEPVRVSFNIPIKFRVN